MLDLRPTCEHCNVSLPPASRVARICSYECTFCATCVEQVLGNSCPNCGGGFVPRPVRPSVAWVGDVSLVEHPASTTVKHRPVNAETHRDLRQRLGGRAPEDR